MDRNANQNIFHNVCNRALGNLDEVSSLIKGLEKIKNPSHERISITLREVDKHVTQINQTVAYLKTFHVHQF